MTISLFWSDKSDALVDSTFEQSHCFAVESDGTGDDLDRFISAITTIAQSQCERCEGYADVALSRSTIRLTAFRYISRISLMER